MKHLRLPAASLWVMAMLAMFTASHVRAAAGGTLQIDVQLIWGTNEEKSPNPAHKAVDDKLSSRLAKSPFKWKHYFEVQRQQVSVPVNGIKEAKMSEHCTLEIKNLGNGRIEVKLKGDGKLVSTNVETLADDWPLILSGDAKNDTAWLVAIQKVTDKAKPK